MNELRKKLFLHTCCAPCAQWPVQLLNEEGYKMTLYYNNPNIHPFVEWKRRLETLEKFSKTKELELISDSAYDEKSWKEQKWTDHYASRCLMCYDLRMQSVAGEAKIRGFSAFTTTLLVSIYQNHEAIIEAATRAARQYGVHFLYRDFRDGYRIGQKMARDDGLYRQKYCGCIYSLDESEYKDKIYAGFPGSSG